ncbi:MAG: hypothetical protein COB04_09740 [Gammaproteobacteria bacterium]|nr:MAG: hypothetical protein COB04_09740 [Gammaproteobacteria bacterium]
MTKHLTVPVTLLFILAIASALRFVGLDFQSLWPDEIYSVRVSANFDPAEIIQATSKDVHPPGYQFILALFIGALNDSELAVRLPSAIAGFLSVFAIYALGKRLFSTREGLLAAALLCISYPAVFYSQEARSFSILLLLTLVTSNLLLKTITQLNTSPSRNNLTLYAYIAVAVLTTYTHYFGLLMVALQGLASLFLINREKSQIKSLVKIYGLIFLFFVPWIEVFFQQLQIKNFWIPTPNIDSLKEFIYFVFNKNTHFTHVSILLMSLGLLLTFWNSLRTSTEKITNTSTGSKTLTHTSLTPYLLLVLWFLLPILLSYIKSIVSTPIFTNRNLIICIPPAYLLLSKAIGLTIDFISEKQFHKEALTVMSTGLILTSGLYNLHDHHYFSKPLKPQYRESIAEIRSNPLSSPSTKVIISDDNFIYYLEKNDLRADHILGRPNDLDIIEALSKQSPYFWFIEGHGVPNQTPLYKALKERFKPAHSKLYFQTRVTLFSASN